MTERASVALRERFNKANRTSAYRFTIPQRTDNKFLDALKHEIKVENAQRRVKELVTGQKQPRLRVVLKGRLGQDNPHAQLYRRGGKLWRYTSQTIRPEHSTRFDVYVHEVYKY
jgi:hypothetical protein